ncbi:MAG: hypothetical protein ACI8R4_003519 [Paracoccaceae bacterium]|jgi:hypothetical protein
MRNGRTYGRRAGLAFAGVAVIAIAAGCNKREDKLFPFDGHYYKVKSSTVDKKATLADFNVTIWQVSQSLDGAREAGGYEGIRYCIKNFGSSTINWTVGPETEPQNLRIVDDTLTFAGRCNP